MIYDTLLSICSPENKIIIDSYSKEIRSPEYIKEVRNHSHNTEKALIKKYREKLGQETTPDYNFGYFKVKDSHFDLLFLPHRYAIDISLESEIKIKSTDDPYVLNVAFSYHQVESFYEIEISIYSNSDKTDDSLNIVYHIDKNGKFSIQESHNTLLIPINSKIQNPEDSLQDELYIFKNTDLIETLFNNYLDPSEIKNTLLLINDFDINQDEIASAIVDQAISLSKNIKPQKAKRLKI